MRTNRQVGISLYPAVDIINHRIKSYPQWKLVFPLAYMYKQNMQFQIYTIYFLSIKHVITLTSWKFHRAPKEAFQSLQVKVKKV